MTINKCRLPVFRTSMINDSRMQMKNSAFFQVSCRTVKLNLTQQQWRGFKNSQIHFGILCFEEVTNNHRWFFSSSFYRRSSFAQLLVIIVKLPPHWELIEITIRHCTRDRRVIGSHVLLFGWTIANAESISCWHYSCIILFRTSERRWMDERF